MRILLTGAPVYSHGMAIPPTRATLHGTAHCVTRVRGGRRLAFPSSSSRRVLTGSAGHLADLQRRSIGACTARWSGLVMQPELFAWNDLHSGLIDRTLEEWQPPSLALHLATPPRRGKPAQVQALIELLAKHFANVSCGNNQTSE